MSDRLAKALLVVLGVVLVALGVLGFLFVRTQRSIARLEEQLAKNGAATAAPAPLSAERSRPARWADEAEPAPTAPRPRRHRDAADPRNTPARPKMPEARRFAEDNELTELDWRTLTRLNAFWIESLKKASEQGEGALPDSLEYLAKQRDLKLHAVLGSDEGVAGYDELEGSLGENRVTFRAKDGKVYGAAPVE